MSKTLDIECCFELVKNLVLEGGRVMREGFNSLKTEYKTKSAFFDLVTEYDKKIEDLLINGIKAKYPHHKFIGEEESAANNCENELTDEPTWIIDPIDGTTNFIRKIPHACISIGLALNKEMIIGIIYNPMLNELYTAKIGQGAFLNGEPIHVRNCKTINQAVIGYEISLIHDKRVRDKNLKRIYKLGSNATGTRSIGTAALSLCYIASGSLDCYHIEDLKAWDIAAGACILIEAGGIVCDTTGGKLNIMIPNLIASCTQELATEIISLIKEADNITEYVFE